MSSFEIINLVRCAKSEERMSDAKNSFEQLHLLLMLLLLILMVLKLFWLMV